jgi:hypothetical protein
MLDVRFLILHERFMRCLDSCGRKVQLAFRLRPDEFLHGREGSHTGEQNWVISLVMRSVQSEKRWRSRARRVQNRFDLYALVHV